VTASAELAERLLPTARQHLASVRLLADSDPYLAYVDVYDAGDVGHFPDRAACIQALGVV
jgi:hypothetical protein